jgi:hypothetical protein
MISPDVPKRVVLCEGVHDSAFWGAMLCQRFQCKEGARDPRGTKETGYSSPSGAFIRIRHLGRKPEWTDVKNEIEEAKTRPTSDIVLSLDLDLEEAFPDFKQARKQRKQDMLRLAQGVKLANDRPLEERWNAATLTAAFPLDSQKPVVTTVSVALWGATADPRAGLPAKQTLERLVCAAFLLAYPATGAPVQAWLDSRPVPPPLSRDIHKAYVASYMAGWHAKRDFQGFFQAVWEDRQVAKHLEDLLKSTLAWDVAERISA